MARISPTHAFSKGARHARRALITAVLVVTLLCAACGEDGDKNQIAVAPNNNTGDVVAEVNLAAITESVVEGGSFVLSVTLSQALGTDVTIAFEVVSTGDNPTVGADFAQGELPSGTLDIPAGSTAATLKIDTLDDDLVEPDETFEVNLSIEGDALSAGTLTIPSTIVDNDVTPEPPVPLLTLRAVDERAEEGQPIRFEAALDTATEQPIAVSFEVVGEGATPASAEDFEGAAFPTGQLTIEAGETAAAFEITALSDALIEGDEGIEVILSVDDSEGPLKLGQDRARATVEDDGQAEAPTIDLVVTTEAVEEGADLIFEVTSSAAVDHDIEVAFEAVGTGDTPAQDNDIAEGLPLSGRLTIAAGETRGQIVLGTVDDGLAELTETVSVTLTVLPDPSGRPVTPGILTGSAQITDNDGSDAPEVSIAALGTGVVEGGALSFAAILDRPAGYDVVLTFEGTPDGPQPAEPEDFEGGAFPTGTITIDAGETSAVFAISTVADGVPEVTESFIVALSPDDSTEGPIAEGDGTVLALIEDDGLAPTPNFGVEVDDDTVTEGLPIFVDITLDAAVDYPVSIQFEVTPTQEAPAQAQDFDGGRFPSGQRTIAPGQTRASIEIATADDALAEPSESFSITVLAAPDHLGPIDEGVTAAVATIEDNDAEEAPTLNIAALEADVVEGGALSFAAILDRPAGYDVLVDVVLEPEGAHPTEPEDTGAVLPSATLTIPAGITSATFTIPTIADDLPEATETFAVALDAGQDNGPVRLERVRASARIRDDENAPAPVVDLSAVAESIPEGATLFFELTIETAVDYDIVIDYASQGGEPPTDPDDFAEGAFPAGQAIILAGQTGALIALDTIDDDIFEETEAVELSIAISNATEGPALTGQDTAEASLEDDDFVPPVLSLQTVSGDVSEGGDLVYVAVLDAAIPVDVRVAFAVEPEGNAPASADDFRDEALPTGEVTIPAGETEGFIVLATQEDGRPEETERIRVTIEAAEGEENVIEGDALDAAGTIRDLRLDDLDGRNGFFLSSDENYEYIGRALGNAGDINGDGFCDLIVGATGYGEEYIGSTFVLFGGEDPPGPVLSASSLVNGDGGFEIRGQSNGNFNGFAVSSAGDFNGDGFGDIVVGTPYIRYNGVGAQGAVTVIFGGDDLDPAGIDLDDVAAGYAPGFIIQGNSDDAHLGMAVGGAGDINGDGFDDIIAGEPIRHFDDTRYTQHVGGAVVVFGGNDLSGTVTTVNEVIDGTTDGFVIREDIEGAAGQVGQSTAIVGDVNGDGFDDVAVTMGVGNLGGSTTHVIFGSEQPFDGNAVDLDDIRSGYGGFVVLSGSAVAPAGDFNGDGFDDIVIGGQFGGYSGDARVVFGRETFPAIVDSEAFDQNPEAGVAIFQGETGQSVGFAVDGGFDVNGDGLDDIVVGDPFATPPDAYSGYGAIGQSHLIFGRRDTPEGGIQIDDISQGIGGITFDGQDGEYNGRAVGMACDVNGDGFAEAMFGAPSYYGAAIGRAYVVFGGDFTRSDRVLGTPDGDDLDASSNDTVLAAQGDDTVFLDGLDFQRIDGGGLFDTLVFETQGVIDFGALRKTSIKGIEALSMDNGEANTLMLPLAAVRALAVRNRDFGGVDTLDNVLVVTGEVGDTLALDPQDGWSGPQGQVVEGFDLYRRRALTIAVSTAVDVTGIIPND